MKLDINKKTLEDRIAAKKAVMLWDSKLIGFGIRISPKGKAAFFANKWVGGAAGRHKRVTLGHYPAMTVQIAKNLAMKELTDAANGIDISARRKEKKTKNNLQGVTLKDAVEQFIKRNAQPGKYWKETEQTLRREFINQFPSGMALKSITKANMRQIIDNKLDQSQSAARVLYAALKPFFDWCVERDIIELSPVSAIKRPAIVKARDRKLTDDEIRAFWRSCEALQYPFGPLFQLLLLTAQRRNEVAGMRWNEISLEGAGWTIPGSRTKNKNAHFVHLSPKAIEIINSLPRLSNEFVFTQTLKTPVSGFSKAKTLLDKTMKPLVPWRIHDLRRSAASIMRGAKVSKDTIEIILNHISGERGGLVSVYQRHELLDERKEGILKLSEYVAQITQD
jgi:integrase